MFEMTVDVWDWTAALIALLASSGCAILAWTRHAEHAPRQPQKL